MTQSDSDKLPSQKPAPVKLKHFQLPGGDRDKPTSREWTMSNYFDIRQEKLAKQAPKAESHILDGVKIYFTGVKSTSQRKLEAMVWKNGGTVLKVWQRKKVTHVISDCLAASKMEKELTADASIRCKAVILRPTWIFESLKEGRMLPTWKFRVVRGPPDVKNIASFFRKAQPLSGAIEKKG